MNSGPMKRALSGRTMRLLLMLLLLVEAHFIADNLPTLIESVVGNGGTVLDVIVLLLLTSPEVIDFALPMAVLIGLYFAITAAREDNELVVCAAAGVPWTAIPRYALRVGILGFAVSILFAGYLTPMGKYAKRVVIHTMESRAIIREITNPTTNNAIRTIKDRTVISTPARDNTAERGNLFIFEPDRGAGWRVSQANDWTVQGPDGDGSYAIQLKSYRDYRDHGDAPDKLSASPGLGLPDQLDIARLNVQNVAVDFRLQELVRAFNKSRNANEVPLVTLAALAGANTAKPVVDRRFGEILARALLCVFAALTAVSAAAWSGTRGGRLVALPVAAVVVLGTDVIGRAMLGDAAAAGASFFCVSFAIACVGAVVLPSLYLARKREAMITPGRGRA